MIVRLSSEAQSDLTAIHAYIAHDNEPAADRVIARILQSVQRLEDFPELGRPGRLNGTREVSIAKTAYLAVYRIEPDLVHILTMSTHVVSGPREVAGHLQIARFDARRL